MAVPKLEELEGLEQRRQTVVRSRGDWAKLIGGVLIVSYLWTMPSVLAASKADALNDNNKECDDLAHDLTSPNPAIRFNALGALTQALNRSMLDGNPVDVSGKLTLFQQVVEIGDMGHIYGVSCFLSRLPEDPQLCMLTTKAVEAEGTALHGKDVTPLLLGSLAYLEKQRPSAFVRFFEGKKYEGLSEVLKSAFATAPVVVRLKDEYCRELLSAYLKWTPESGRLDQENPFRAKLLVLGSALTPIVETVYGPSGQALPLPVIWVLGEIGDPLAFDILLREYLARPSVRTAISLGGCLGSLSASRLFAAPFTAETTRTLLKDIYGDKWDAVKDLSADALKDNLSNDLDAIRSNCRRRSVPQLG